MSNNIIIKDGNAANKIMKTTEDVLGINTPSHNIENLPLSAFGEMLSVGITPKIQLQFPYNLNTDLIVTGTTGAGTTTQGNSLAVISTGASASSSAFLESKDVLKYNTGQGGLVRFTSVFTTGVVGSNQIFGYGDTTDGYQFGYEGNIFGVFRHQNGTRTFTPQASFSEDKMDGTGNSGQIIDPTKGNVYQIDFQWLGFGQITFSIEDKETGKFTPVHKIKYANTNLVPSIFNPSLPIRAFVENTTNTSDIKVSTASIFGAIQGKEQFIGNTKAAKSTKASGTNTNILTIRNKSTYQSKTNRVRIKLSLLTVSTDGTQPVTFDLYKNQTITAPTFVDVGLNTSVIEFDTVGTIAVVDGSIITSIGVTKLDSDKFFLGDLDIIVAPGETLTIVSNGTNAATTATVTWKELF